MIIPLINGLINGLTMPILIITTNPKHQTKRLLTLINRTLPIKHTNMPQMERSAAQQLHFKISSNTCFNQPNSFQKLAVPFQTLF